MSKKMFFESDYASWVEYDFENDFLNIDCVVNINKSEKGASLFLVDNNGTTLNLGTLSVSDKCSSLSKSYPLSYLRFQEIDYENIKGFEIDKDEKLILSTFEQNVKTSIASTDESEDPALVRAKEILGGLGSADYSCEANEYISSVNKRINSYCEKNITEIPGFKWYIIDDIKETFNLTSVEHLIFCENFVRLFAKNGEWYFGVGEKPGVYALCIKSCSKTVIPFQNASDCTKFIPVDEFCGYWIVGIGLFSDGQYFCRL